MCHHMSLVQQNTNKLNIPIPLKLILPFYVLYKTLLDSLVIFNGYVPGVHNYSLILGFIINGSTQAINCKVFEE